MSTWTNVRDRTVSDLSSIYRNFRYGAAVLVFVPLIIGIIVVFILR